ncbi:hypothetical protein AALB51_16695 [Lachnospiraceae bacterium 62-26]
MEKTVYIDDTPVRLKSTAALPKRYKAQFRRDYFADLFKIAKVFDGKKKEDMDLKDITYENLERLDMDVLYDIVWTLAKTADKSIPDPLEWYDGFENFNLMKVLPQVQELIKSSVSQSKKSKR